MIKILLTLIITTLLFGGCQQDSTNSSWQLLGGSTFKPKQLNNKVIFINYWAQWCAPCLKEMPELAEFAQNNKQDAVVLAVNFDGVNAEEMAKQATKFNIQLPMLLGDPSTQYGWQRQSVLPYTLIVDSQLNLIDTLIGPQTVHSLQSWLENYSQQ